MARPQAELGNESNSCLKTNERESCFPGARGEVFERFFPGRLQHVAVLVYATHYLQARFRFWPSSKYAGTSQTKWVLQFHCWKGPPCRISACSGPAAPPAADSGHDHKVGSD
jgi:hypothetical protein